MLYGEYNQKPDLWHCSTWESARTRLTLFAGTLKAASLARVVGAIPCTRIVAALATGSVVCRHRDDARYEPRVQVCDRVVQLNIVGSHMPAVLGYRA